MAIPNPISAWYFDESSGNAADSYGTNTLTNNNATPFVAGKINNGADFERGNSNSFSITDAAQTGLDIMGDFSISLWANFETQSGDTLVSKFGGGGNRSFRFSTDGPDTAYLDVINSVDASAQAYWSSIGLAGGFNHLVVTWRASTSKANLYINGVAQAEMTTTGVTDIKDSTAPFVVGDDGGNFMDGILDIVIIWDTVLTQGNVDELYNSGAGVQPSFAPAELTADVSLLGYLIDA